VALLLALAMSQIKTTVPLMLVTKILITAAVFISPFLIQRLVRYLQTKYNISAFIVSSKKRKWLLLAVYAGTLVMATALMFQDNLAIGPDADMTNMTWSQFERHCTVTGANTIKRQEECSELKGMAINWKGSVDSVKIIKIENSFETLLDYLPDSLGQSLRCFYDTNITNIMYQSGMSPNPCSLTTHNVYTFELELSGPYGERVISSNKGHILLTAVHAFREILEAVDEGDVVRFVASFDQYPIYRYPPKLKLLELECVMCKQLMKTKDRSRLRVVGGGRLGSDKLWYRCFHAFKFLFNFIYAPLFRIET